MGVWASFMLVPETSVDENSQPVLGQHQVGTARQVPSAKPEAQSHPVGDPAHRPLGGSVPAADVGHQLAPPSPVHDVDHM